MYNLIFTKFTENDEETSVWSFLDLLGFLFSEPE